MSRSKPRKISWDVVRVVAVFSVLLGHITHQGPFAHPELGDYPFRDTAQFGAAVLMVISGFFVCQTIRRGGTARWWWCKVARLLPPYVIAVLITYVVMRFAGAAFNHQTFDSGWFGTLFGPTSDGLAWVSSWYVPVGHDLLINLFLLQGWNQYFIWLDGSYWTLPVQLMVFSGAAMLWAGTPWLRGTRRAQLLAWGLVVVPLFVRFVVIGVHNPAPWAYSVVFGLGLHRMHAFAAGIGIWLWSRNRLGGGHLTLLLIAVIAAQDLHLYPDHVALPSDPARLPSDLGFAVMLLLVCAAAKGPDWSLLRPLAPVFTWLAGISYGVYLLHQELGYVLARLLLDAGVPGWVRLPILVAAAVIAGWLLTTLVERPAYSRLTRPRRMVPSPRTAPDDLLPGSPSGPAPVSVGGPS
ncbi:acyltransferase family protein [Amycolatopsis pithecellobii]|uniref:acyltransferase family protein n=1 Tax=Amycolatopsis pithecellobii TaxID=664692 RepID=UPI0028AB2021|nr:acyltransferase [Amycolatopsis pithecellobii]